MNIIFVPERRQGLSALPVNIFLGVKINFSPLVCWKEDEERANFHYLYSQTPATIVQGNFCNIVLVACINVIVLNFTHCLPGLYCRIGHGELSPMYF